MFLFARCKFVGTGTVCSGPVIISYLSRIRGTVILNFYSDPGDQLIMDLAGSCAYLHIFVATKKYVFKLVVNH
jgi:hypothetical protein